MKVLRATDMAHAMIAAIVRPGDTVLDATAGNGHDTAFLAGLVGIGGRVFAFDVQPLAIQTARARLGTADNITWVAAGHERLADHVPAGIGLTAAMFNLGYLPGSDKRIVTSADTTLAALNAVLDRLRVGGRVTLILYTGHPGGADEANQVKAAVARLPKCFASGVWARLATDVAAPELVAIDRLV
jgi:hypothetical protein